MENRRSHTARGLGILGSAERVIHARSARATSSRVHKWIPRDPGAGRGRFGGVRCARIAAMPRALTDPEIARLLTSDVPANLATLDGDGYPHVTPVWFLWTGDALVMTSMSERPHVLRLRHDARAGVCIHVEEAERE